MLCSCIYLSGKINEDFRRIRDIINTLLFIKNKYNNLENSKSFENDYIENLRNDDYLNDDSYTLIKTTVNLSLDNVNLKKI
jgi:hypothetical protein